jgi:HEAT repeat protein
MVSSQQIIGIFTTDANLTISSWDDWLAQATGIPADTAKGKSLVTLFPDLEHRGMIARFNQVLKEGIVEVLAPAFHHYLLPCPAATPSRYFDRMQQRVTIAPLSVSDSIVGTIVTVEDVTSRLDRERDRAEQLGSENEVVRLNAAKELMRQDVLDPTDQLMGALGDQSWRVRMAAVDGLVRHSGQGGIKSLLRSLREEHQNLGVLNSALQVLALSGVDAIAPLVECLGDSDVDLRVYSAHALGDQHDPRAIPALISALQDPDANVRYHVIEALGKLRATDSLGPLLDIVESGDFYLAFPALDALTQIGDRQVARRIVPLLQDEMLRVPAADALGKLGDEETVPPLVALLNKPSAPVQVIAQALASLYDRYQALYREGNYIAELARKHLKATGTQNLLDAVHGANDDALRTLARVLGWMEGEAIERALTRLLGCATARKEVVEALVRYGSRVTELLIENLETEDFETRLAAVFALGRIGDARAVPSLVGILSSDHELVIAAAGALAKIGDRRAFEPLLSLLGHPQAAVRQSAIAAINSIGHPEMPQRAVSLLNDPHPHVRESAIRIAGYFGYAECIDLILERCRDDDEGVRRTAIEHIPYLDDERAAFILADAIENGTPRVRASAAQAFAQVDSSRARFYLNAALNDQDHWVRYFAARSIQQHDSSECVNTLARLAKRDPADHVRIAAIESLARIGGQSVIGSLVELAQSSNSDLSRAALSGLGKIDLHDALPPLLSAIKSADPERRINATRALGERPSQEVIHALQWVAATDSDERVVQSAIDSLVRLATPEAIDALLTLTADPNRRDSCVLALAQLGDKAIESVGKGLSNPQSAVRRATVAALGRTKQSRASELLNHALDDEDAGVRLAAVNELAFLGSRSAARKLVTMARSDADPGVRRAAQRALQR